MILPDGVLVLVEVRDEVPDAALGVELLALLLLAALVRDRDPEALGEERRVPEALLEDAEVHRQRLEDVAVRQEVDGRAGLVGGLALLERAARDASLVGLRPREAVALDGGRQLVRERVDDRRADAVQTAGDLVAATLAELAAGVQDGEHDLEGGLVLLLHLRDRDAAAVVGDRDGVVRMDRDRDRVAVAGEGLVHRVVHDLVDEVVQTAYTGRADVHARALAHGFETLEDGDVLGVVAGLRVAVLGIAGAQGSPSSTHKRRPGSDSASGAGPWPIVASDISSRRVRNTDARAYHSDRRLSRLRRRSPGSSSG